MRLIDADVLIKHLTDWRLQECPIGICDEETETYKTICECIDAVKQQPTAFDVEKVVADIEKIKDMGKRTYHQLELTACVYAVDKAIEIVKRGGVNE